ncbi:MAG: hypothetical protein ACI841_000158 [Planctomycetota bacterium]|jgi:hypothetical protein
MGMFHSIRVLPVFLLLLLASPAHAQGWMDKHTELGLSLPRLDDFEPLPTQPAERFVALQFLEKIRAEGAGEGRSTCLVAIVPHQAREEDDPTNAEAYLDLSMHGWKREALRGSKTRFGYRSRSFDLSSDDGAQVGHTHVWSGAGRDVIWIGLCERSQETRFLSHFRSIGERMKFHELREDVSQRGRWERHYKQQRLVDAEGRIVARLALVDGWEAHDSKHYIALDHSGDERLMETMTRKLEYLRTELSGRWPAAKRSGKIVERVAKVRVCRDRAEYLAYGGWKDSAGYWNPQAGELVLFDPRPNGGSEADFWITLHHEASHQYIHQATGGIVPHSWFDEGLADWFSCAVFDGARIRSVATHPWRMHTARSLLSGQEAVSLEELLNMPQAVFYASGARNYALAWSLVFYLESDTGKSRADYARILPTYYKSLQEALARSLQRNGGAMTSRTLGEVAESARETALEQAFARIDIKALESAWKAFVLSLPQ